MHSVLELTKLYIMSRNLLIVEDDAITALAVKQSLEDYGYSTVIAHSGREALKLLKEQNTIELILMDIDLGEAPDGTETAQQILSKMEIPIIFHSSHTEPEITAKTEKITSYGYVVKNSGITVLDASIKMAFRLFDSRKKEKKKTEKSITEKSLSESEIRYREMFENMNNCVAIYEAVGEGADFIIKDFNSSAEKTEQVKREDIINKPVTKIFTGIKALGLLDVFQDVWRTGKPRHHPVSFYEGNRISGWRENYVYKLPSGEIVAIYEDKTEIMQAQEALKRSEEQLKNILKDLSFIVVTIDQTGKLLFCNDYFLKITGWKKEEIIGKNWFDTSLPEDVRLKVLDDTFTEKQKVNGPPSKYENEILTKQGERRLILWSNTVFRNTADLTPTFTSVGEDITAQMQLARQQEEIIHEKELILKEVHHRIKNNMATMKSLLEIQAYSLKDDSVQKLMLDAAGRMNSMMLLYDRLYTSESIESFSFSEYLESLVDDIVASACLDIDVELEVQKIILPVHFSSILGIIINEIITNSMKYAFSEKKENRLSVKIKQIKEKVSVVISDNGPGFNPSEKNKGFGFSLIKELTIQLKGEMELSTEDGTTYSFLFPIEESSASS